MRVCPGRRQRLATGSGAQGVCKRAMWGLLPALALRPARVFSGLISSHGGSVGAQQPARYGNTKGHKA
jgi:hypothetical protein